MHLITIEGVLVNSTSTKGKPESALGGGIAKALARRLN
jgi:hypothetical protein